MQRFRAFHRTQMLSEDKKEAEVSEDAKKASDKSVEELQAEIKDLNEKLEDMKMQAKYALAECENVRKIASRDVASAKEFGVQKLVKSIFSVVDTTNICIKNTPKDGDTSALKTIKKDIHKVLGEYGVQEFSPKLGDEFDYNFHDALFNVPYPEECEHQPGTIGAILKSGWKRKDTVIRAAQVGVYPKDVTPTPKSNKEKKE